MSSAFCKVAGCLLPARNLVNHTLFFQSSLLRELGHSKFIPERLCGDVQGRVAVFTFQNYNFTKSNSIMIFSWEFSKVLESIIFRNIFICVQKWNYIKNYMKTRRETRRGGRSSPHFELINRTEHLYYTRRRRNGKWLVNDLSKNFKTRSRTSQLKIFTRKENHPIFFLLFFSIYSVFTEEFYSLLCFHNYYILEEFRPVSAK